MAQQKLLKFKELNDRLLSSAESYLSSWLPGGKRNGHEFVVGSLGGEAGRSLSINMQTGVWKDFSTGQGGGDLISLYAEIHHCKQGEAYKALAGDAPIKKAATQEKLTKLVPPPRGSSSPHFNHRQHGKPSAIYPYRDEDGHLLFYITRFDLDDGKKLIRPWSYTEDGEWVQKHWPTPRPLYGLETLTDKVLLVEGEKAADVARKKLKKLSVLTWPGGASAIDRVDWSSLYGRSVLIWPDHDDPGRKAAAGIAAKLLSHCPTVKVIDTSSLDLPDGFDAADYDYSNSWSKWVKPLAKLIEPPNLPAKTEPAAPPEPQMGLKDAMYDGKQRIICSAYNASLYLLFKSKLNGRVWFDAFYQDYMTDVPHFGGGKLTEPEPLNDGLILKARMSLQSVPGFEKISKSDTEDSLKALADRDIRNEPKDWLESVEWDHTPRLDTWLIDYAGAPDNEYVRAVSKNIVLAMCKRIVSPGAKFDHVLVLHAKQGAGKSQVLRALVGKYMSELSRSIKREGKDALLALRAKLLVELSEGAALAGMSNDEKKSFITSEVDTYRAPYARAAKDHPRTAVICITTNNYDFLDDITGDRRYWPVMCGECKYEELKEVRAQLFAEAHYRLKLEESHFYVPPDLAEEAREEFTFMDEIAEDIVHYANSRASGYVRSKDVYKAVINADDADMKQFTKKMQKYIGATLRGAGYKRCKRRIDGVQTKVFEKDVVDQFREMREERSPLKNHAPNL